MTETWRYDRGDALAFVTTMAGVLVLGVEQGAIAGMVLSLATLVWRASRSHMAVVGHVPDRALPQPRAP